MRRLQKNPHDPVPRYRPTTRVITNTQKQPLAVTRIREALESVRETYYEGFSTETSSESSYVPTQRPAGWNLLSIEENQTRQRRKRLIHDNYDMSSSEESDSED